MTALAAMLAILVATNALDSAAAEELVVIVHPERTASVSAPQLAQIYLKKRRFWPDGAPIVPVNRESESFERENFTNAVFGDIIEKLRIYWNRQYFLGVLPPATLASDEAIKAFVAQERSAIGYIRASSVDDSVQVALRLPPVASAPPAED